MYRTLLARCEYHGNDTQSYIPNENKPCTHTLLASKVRYISHLGDMPNIAEPHVFKQGAVHCLATT